MNPLSPSKKPLHPDSQTISNSQRNSFMFDANNIDMNNSRRNSNKPAFLSIDTKWNKKRDSIDHSDHQEENSIISEKFHDSKPSENEDYQSHINGFDDPDEYASFIQAIESNEKSMLAKKISQYSHVQNLLMKISNMDKINLKQEFKQQIKIQQAHYTHKALFGSLIPYDNIQKLKKAIIEKITLENAIKKRKLLRILYLLTFIAIFIFLMVFCPNLLFITGSYNFQNITSFNITIKNCKFHIQQSNDNDINPVSFSYRIPSSSIITSDSSSNYANYIDANSLTTINFINTHNIQYCQITMKIKPSVTFNNLFINCYNCTIVDKTTKMTIQNEFLINGSAIHANLHDLNVGNFAYQSDIGYLQLNNIITSNQAAINYANLTSKGDIIIQSINGYILTYYSKSNAHCFSAPYTALISEQNCASSTNSQINSACQGLIKLCTQITCMDNPSAQWIILVTLGNLYGNIIPIIDSYTTYQPVKSWYTSQGILFDPNITQGLFDYQNSVNNQSSVAPSIMIDLGDRLSHSSLYSKWIIESNPSYAFMKPWWLTTFSADLLTNDIIKVQGYLLPGFCPWRPTFSLGDLYMIQIALEKAASLNSSIYSLIWDHAQKDPIDAYTTSTGVYSWPLSKSGEDDHWYTILFISDAYTLKDNDITKNIVLIISISLSLVIALLISYILMKIAIIALNVAFNKALSRANHLQNYKKLEKLHQKKLKKKSLIHEVLIAIEDHFVNKVSDFDQEKSTISLTNIIFHAPAIAAFIDYLTLVLHNIAINSVNSFFSLLFTQIDPDDSQNLDLGKTSISVLEAKILYEKYCFLSGLVEEKLMSTQAHQQLSNYGFKFIKKNNASTDLYCKIILKNHDQFIQISSIQGKSSQELFIEHYIQFTQFYNDQIEVEYLNQVYMNFCTVNKLEISTDIRNFLISQYKVEVIQAPKLYIVPIETHYTKHSTQLDDDLHESIKDDYNNEEDDGNDQEQGLLIKGVHEISNKLRNINKKKKSYAITKNKLESHFSLLSEKGLNMENPKVIEDIKIQLILMQNWFIWDAITVLFHMSIYALISVPLMFLMYFMEIQYAPYSLKSDSLLIQPNMIIEDPHTLMTRLTTLFSWNNAIIIIIIIYWFVAFIDTIIYYMTMDFPQEIAIKSLYEKPRWISRLSRGIFWGLTLFLIACYFAYFGLVLIWSLLGAIVDPSKFLPYASGALTFVTFCTTKFNEFKELSLTGKGLILGYLEGLFSRLIVDIMKKLMAGYEKLESNILDQLKPQGVIDNITNSLLHMGLLDNETKREVEKRIESLEMKTVINDGLTVVSTVITDPSILQRESDKMICTLQLKAKEKAIQECEKMNIPSDLAKIMISIVTRDKESLRKLLPILLEKIGSKGPLASLLLEMIFTDSSNYTISKKKHLKYLFIQILFQPDNPLLSSSLNTVSSMPISPELIISIFKGVLYLFNHRARKFTKLYSKLIKSVDSLKNNNLLQQIDPILKIMAIFSDNLNENSLENDGNYDDKLPTLWEVRILAIQSMIYLLKYLQLTTDMQNHRELEKLQYLVEFIPIVTNLDEAPFDIYQPSRILDSSEIGQVIENFVCKTLGQTENVPEISLIINTALCYLDKNFAKFPELALKTLQKLIPNSQPKYIDFWLKMFNFVHLSRSFIDKKIDKVLSTYVSRNQALVLKFIQLYRFKELQDCYSYDSLLTNKLMNDISNKIGLCPSELIGLIDLFSDRIDSIHASRFVRLLMNRMKVNDKHYMNILNIYKIYNSTNEKVLQKALNYFGVHNIQFLLVGKRLLNPKYIDENKWHKLGINDIDLLNEKNKVFMKTESQYEKWKQEVRVNLDEVQKKLQEYMNKSKPKMAAMDIGFILEYLQRKKKKLANEDQYKYREIDDSIILKEFSQKIRRIQLFLADWNTGIALNEDSIGLFITTLTTIKNALFPLMFQEAKSSQNRPIDVLLQLLKLRYLTSHTTTTNNSNYYSSNEGMLNKEAAMAIHELSSIMYLNQIELTKFLSLITLKSSKDYYQFIASSLNLDQPNVTSCITFAIANINQQKETLLDQYAFMTQILPRAFGLTNFLEPFVMRLYHGVSYAISYQQFYDIIYKVISHLIKYDTPIANSEQLDKTILQLANKLMEFYRLIQGTLPPEKALKIFNVKDGLLKRIIMNFSEPDISSSIAELMNTIQDNSPFKLYLAWYAFFMKYDRLKIKKQPIGMETIQMFLGRKYRLVPEFFDFIHNLTQGNSSLFADKLTNLIRKYNNDFHIDHQFITAILGFINAEWGTNLTTIARRLDISSDKLEFMICFSRLQKSIISSASKLETELENCQKNPSFKKIMESLSINYEEVIYLIQLLVTHSTNKTIMSNVLSSFHVQNLIVTHIYDNILKLIKQPDQKITIQKSQKNTFEIYNSSQALFKDLRIVYPNYAIFVSRIMAGDFLSINYWYQNYEIELLNMQQHISFLPHNILISLCGYTNRFVRNKFNMDHHIKKYCLVLQSSDSSQRYDCSTEQKFNQVKPTNSLAFAISFLHHTLDISVSWARIFSFDESFYIKNLKEGPSNKIFTKEFILTYVLNMLKVIDSMRYALGALEFIDNSLNLLLNSPTNPYWDKIIESCKDIRNNLEINIIESFYKNFEFDYQCLIKLAKTYIPKSKINQLINTSSSEDFILQVKKSIIALIALAKFNPDNAQKEQQQQQFEQELFFKDAYAQSQKDIHTLFQLLVTGKTNDSTSFQNEAKFFYDHIIKKTYTIIDEDYYYGKEKIKGWQMTNLSILSGLSLIKHAQVNQSYTRIVYNLHGIILNIERKFLQKEEFWNFMKFPMMKILGLSCGYRLSNIIEWVLPSSLLLSENAVKILNKDINSERLKLDHLVNKVLSNISNPAWCIGSHKAEYSNNDPFFLLKHDSWRALANYFDFPGATDGSYFLSGLDLNEDDSKSLKECIFTKESLGLLQTIIDHQRLIMSKNVYENKNDFRFGDLQKYIENIRALEITIFHPEIIMIMGIINGDDSIFDSRVNYVGSQRNDLVKQGYKTLFGLQSLCRFDRLDRKKLKKLLISLSKVGNISSDLDNLEEILASLIDREITLDRICTKLGIRKYKEWLNLGQIISLSKLQAHYDENDSLKEILVGLSNNNTNSLNSLSNESLTKIAKILKESGSLTDQEIDTILLIMELYEMKESAWIKLIHRLNTDNNPSNCNSEFVIDVLRLICQKSLYKFSKNKALPYDRYDNFIQFLKDPLSSSQSLGVNMKFNTDHESYLKKLQRLMKVICQQFPHESTMTWIEKKFTWEPFVQLFDSIILSQKKTFIELYINMQIGPKTTEPPSSISLENQISPENEINLKNPSTPGNMASPTNPLIPVNSASPSIFKDQLEGSDLLKCIVHMIWPNDLLTDHSLKILKIICLMDQELHIVLRGDCGIEKHEQILNELINDIFELNLLKDYPKEIHSKLISLIIGLITWNENMILKALKEIGAKHEYACLMLMNLLMNFKKFVIENDIRFNEIIKKVLNILHLVTINNITDDGLNTSNETSSNILDFQYVSEIEDLYDSLGNLSNMKSTPKLSKFAKEKINTELTIKSFISSLITGNILDQIQELFKSKDEKLYKISSGIIDLITFLTDDPNNKTNNGDYENSPIKAVINNLEIGITSPIMKTSLDYVMNLIDLYCMMKQLDLNKLWKIIQNIIGTNPHDIIVIFIKLISRGKINPGDQGKINPDDQVKITDFSLQMILDQILLLLKVLGLSDKFHSANVIRGIIELIKFIDRDIGHQGHSESSLGSKIKTLINIMNSIINNVDVKMYEAIIDLVFEQDLTKNFTFYEIVKIFLVDDKYFDLKNKLIDIQARLTTNEVNDGIIRTEKSNTNSSMNNEIFELEKQMTILKQDLQIIEDMLQPKIKFISKFFVKELANYFDFSTISKNMLDLASKNQTHIKRITKSITDSKQLQMIMNKIAEGNVNNKDLFKLLCNNKQTNTNTITSDEFQRLTCRLGFKLSPHKIIEIMSAVKKISKASESLELCEEEFEKAMNYLKSRSVILAMNMLGISPETLTQLLILLILLLILILIFIFLGIQAFAMGGIFGAIVNSLFPILSGIGLKKQSETHIKKLNEDSISNACEKSMDILQTQHI